ncbi:MAG: hypothetical protein Q4C61_06510 [Lachnospiraceae bacterium]|nr:hypothetical protein [Lachnospiraceae bacterium]
MKVIKFFLASSIVEFKHEREELGNYIRALNDIYVQRGIYFELTICEDLSNAVAKERKQEEYNEKIRESQFFYILLGKEAGEYTIEEFDVALEKFRESGAPHIYTYFKQLPGGEQASESVLNFMERLDKQIGHYFSMFTHLDSIKLNILIELTRREEISGKLQFENGQAVLDGRKLLSLEHVPIYSQNEELQRRSEEKARLEEEFVRLRRASIEAPEDEEIFGRLMEVSRQRNELSEQIRQMESNILNLYTTIAELRSGDRPMTRREKMAGRLLDQGDYEGALAILRDEERQKELAHAEKIVENGKERIRGYISENRMRISALESRGITLETIPEIQACYEESVRLAEKYRVELDVLLWYADFLWRQHEDEKAINILERLAKYQDSEAIEQFDLVWAKYFLGMLYLWSPNDEKAEALLTEVLEYYEKVLDEGTAVNEGKMIALSYAYLSFADLRRDSGTLRKTARLLCRALKRCRILVEADSSNDDYKKGEALYSVGLARCLEKMNKKEGAVKLYRESLRISRELSSL